MNPPNDLLDDLKNEHHSNLLENGNLRGKARESKWTGEFQWTSQGYIARVARLHCTCGQTTPILVGLFHLETTPSGTRRERRLDEDHYQIDPNGSYPIIVNTTQVKTCPHCLIFKGFQYHGH